MVQKQQERSSSSSRKTEAEPMTDEEIKAAKYAGSVATESVNEADLDELMNSIDDVLEENAQQFVDGFVQQNGQ